MKIAVCGINFAPELTGIGKYSGEMVEFLASKGHQVTVVTAPPYYPEWEIQKPYKKWWYKFENLLGAKVIRCPIYVPKNPSTLTRLLHLSSFALSGFFALFSQIFKKTDVIIVIEPTLFCAPGVLLFAKITGAKTWLHIQDFEIDAMFGLGMAGRLGFLKKWVYICESWLLQKFDVVSSISHSMVRRAHYKGIAESRLRFFPNWADMDFIRPMPEDSYYRELWQYNPEDYIVLYAGNIGKKQGLEIILSAASHFISQPHIRFVIVGDGAHKSTLKEEARGLPNVQFRPLQPYDKLSQLMAFADVHLIVQKAGAADLVLPSKLTTILAAGGYSIITADKDTALGDFCEANPGVAQRVPPENTAAIVVAIEQMVASADQRDKVNVKAREYAGNYIARDAVLLSFESDLLGLIEGSQLTSRR